ncbi:hypothetical protein E4T44_05487 [Aureobasidium sp. EXF-8845]|nr:hypothetical protein E4T44_05487 [Aureobasidium sp. EXF-8845]KAI4847691.1 hypothetical protein E4T45_06661 [Aureobasidium sp. EXF-8846]
MPSSQPGEYKPVSWTEIFCQCLPMRNPKPTTEPDIEMQSISSSSWPPRSTSLRTPTNLNNPVIPDSIVRANNPDNITRPSHNSWWLREDDDDRSVPSAPPSRSGARNPIASCLSDTSGHCGRRTPPRTKNPYTVTWLDPAPRPSSSVYMSGGLAASSGNDVRVPDISPRAASYAAVLDVQAGIDARKSKIPQPSSPTGSVDSIDFFSGAAARTGFGERGGKGEGRFVPKRPERFEGVSPYIA